MKITDFKGGGKQYRLPHWLFGRYVLFNVHGLLINMNRKYFPIHRDDINRDDWEEYKEAIDYGTKEQLKLMLIKSNTPDSSPAWIEAYGFCEDAKHIILDASWPIGPIKLPKNYILKVIDLPSKELTNEQI